MHLDFYKIVLYFYKNYNVNKRNLSTLSFSQITELIYRFPYSMSTIMKNESSYVYFEGKELIVETTIVMLVGKS